MSTSYAPLKVQMALARESDREAWLPVAGKMVQSLREVPDASSMLFKEGDDLR